MGALHDLARAIAADQAMSDHDRAEAYAIAEGEPRVVAHLFWQRWYWRRQYRGRSPGERVLLTFRPDAEAPCPSE